MQELIEALGYQCMAFASGDELLSNIVPNQRAMVIADANMPNMCGLALRDQLARQGFEYPFVLISGQSTIEGEDISKHPRLAGFLHKPFGVQDLRVLFEQVFPESGSDEIQ